MTREGGPDEWKQQAEQDKQARAKQEEGDLGLRNPEGVQQEAAEKDEDRTSDVDVVSRDEELIRDELREQLLEQQRIQAAVLAKEAQEDVEAHRLDNRLRLDSAFVSDPLIVDFVNLVGLRRPDDDALRQIITDTLADPQANVYSGGDLRYIAERAKQGDREAYLRRAIESDPVLGQIVGRLKVVEHGSGRDRFIDDEIDRAREILSKETYPFEVVELLRRLALDGKL